ncbi:glutaminyl-peptide cyclotransferase [Corynebacterium sp. 320]|uniref:glutaminyl-peptide cyclotransferase n=1 Tax=Corynebacterium TaxID=1716 RepID=UPI00125CAF17|nr:MULTISPECIES: glutaminyl-peptide cyclotransferase [Corynebacterium]KAB1501337.1 glutaminyl-peptide cyclotransferase [Corynebacterium sp. 320]KAB1551666.1 glutaminyl-peptide cyclotransferase [Corynebacterium sp. 319]KAB3525702.1 glutaminyl-peptide cyclotransferase [Corynebacterium sp. 250]KAB3538656.1 glutaminyl-peptide cyclotransferase [Corynebacterium sp. 366]QNP92615.1 glutaminyl-peptide cyclotransferase [Corynebacterium zhongnanshanii]
MLNSARLSRRSTHRVPWRAVLAAVLGLGAATSLAACSSSSETSSSSDAPQAHTLTAEVLAAHPWDKSSFTQGLEVAPDGSLLVGTGMYSQSRIYRTTLDNKQSQNHNLPAEFFGEGIALHGDHVWQLTWKEHVAIKRKASDLSEVGRVEYPTEGWGLCSDGQRLVMSDGTSTLYFRDPDTFEELGRVDVTLHGDPLPKLNELDCSSDGSVWANVWQRDDIVRIDPDTGEVKDVVDLAGMLPAQEDRGADVLNGIASIPGTSATERKFYVTGKYWDELYEVQFKDK